MKNSIEMLEGTANFLRGMMFDPAIPKTVKQAIQARVDELDWFTETKGWTPVADADILPGESVLVLYDDDNVIEARYDGAIFVANDGAGYPVNEVTHVQPMPEPFDL